MVPGAALINQNKFCANGDMNGESTSTTLKQCGDPTRHISQITRKSCRL